VTILFELNHMAKTRELVSRSSGSPWRTAIERRRAIRYPLQLPASFSWADEGGVVRQGGGHTRNISEKGAYVDATVYPPINSSVELHFSLPALSDSSRGMHVQHTGETLRLEATEQGEHSWGFAISSREVVWRDEDGNKLDGNEEGKK
jgi:hypothetical protein